MEEEEKGEALLKSPTGGNKSTRRSETRRSRKNMISKSVDKRAGEPLFGMDQFSDNESNESDNSEFNSKVNTKLFKLKRAESP